MDFERGIVCRSHLGAISSECEVMFVFLSCPDSKGVDRTLSSSPLPSFQLPLRLHNEKSLHTVKFETLQSCPVFFLGTVSASWKAKQRMDYLLFLLYCSRLFYLVFHLSFHLGHKKVIHFIQTGRCSDFFLTFWLISAPSLFFLFKSRPGLSAFEWMSEVLNPKNCICHFVISPHHHWECLQYVHTVCIIQYVFNDSGNYN